MNNKLADLENELDVFLPILKQYYPEGRSNTNYLSHLQDLYSQVALPDGILIVLYDHRTASIFYISDNIKNVSGYSQATITKWKFSLFKALHYSHYSFAFSAIKRIPPFSIKQSPEDRMNVQLSCCGLKMIDNKGKIRRVFIKNKTLLVDEKGLIDVSLVFVEEVTHLLKGDHYWYRVACQEDEFVYVRQKGKKLFSTLLSAREKEILQLIEQKKKTTEIAKTLFISKLTVETHRKNMLQRSGATDTTALIQLCKMAKIL